MTLLTIGLSAQAWVDGDVLFIDEGHALSHEVQESLYRIIDERQGLRVDNHPATGEPTLNGSIKVAAVTILLATDQAGALLPAPKKRFELTFDFQSYTLPEVIAIVRQRAPEKGMLLKPLAARLLVQSSRGIPRTAGHRLDCLAKYWREANPGPPSIFVLLQPCLIKPIRSVEVHADQRAVVMQIAYERMLIHEPELVLTGSLSNARSAFSRNAPCAQATSQARSTAPVECRFTSESSPPARARLQCFALS